MHFPGGQKSNPGNPSQDTPNQPYYPPSCMASSANQVGRSPPRRFTWSTCGTEQTEYLYANALWVISTTGGGPWRSDRPASQRDSGWLSTGRPRRRLVSARDEPFHLGRTWPRSPAPGRGLVPHPMEAAPGRSGSSGPSASPRTGTPHPCGPSGNGP